MKTQKHFKQVMMTAALVLAVGNLTSCKDQDFDWDAAHANTAQKKFTNAFIEAFGKPEAGHQWGFDMPWNKENDTRSVTTVNDLVVVKPEGTLKNGGNPNNVDDWNYNDGYQKYFYTYGTVPYITEQEHKDVFEWFSKHQVTWENTTEKIGKLNDGYTYTFYDANNNKVDSPTSGVTYAKVTKAKEGETTTTVTGRICIDSGNADGYIVKLVYFSVHNNEVASNTPNTRNENGGTAVTTGKLSSGNTIKSAYRYDGTISGVTSVDAGMHINFQHAWIQYVASSDINATELHGLGDIQDETQLITGEKLTGQTAGQFNYLRIYPASGGSGHGENINSGKGPGYGWTPDIQKMGVLALGANLNQLAMQVSTGDYVHDKWYIVYLEGDGYAGWYLGFDLEGAQLSDASGQYKANGICNDMIIKLTSVNPYVEEYPTNCRIMCEDLGGFNNEVTIGEESHISDIDYNDVVIDVTSNDNKVVNITLQAAGGTLPLTVWYDGYPLFETHEFFSEYVVRSNYELCSSGCSSQSKSADTPTTNTNYKTMYNTEGGSNATTTDDVDSRTVTLLCNTSRHCTNEGRKAVRFNGDFDLSKLEIKVWRQSAEDYILEPSSLYSPAEWLTISNYEGEAPLKICVPDTVQWLKERDAVDLGYPSFKTWVGDHSQYFWKASDVNTNYLCTKRKPSKPSVCTCTETGGSGSTGGGSTGGGQSTANSASITNTSFSLNNTDISTSETIPAEGGTATIAVNGNNLGTVTITPTFGSTTGETVTASGNSYWQGNVSITIPENTETEARNVTFSVTATSSESGGNSATATYTFTQAAPNAAGKYEQAGIKSVKLVTDKAGDNIDYSLSLASDNADSHAIGDMTFTSYKVKTSNRTGNFKLKILANSNWNTPTFVEINTDEITGNFPTGLNYFHLVSSGNAEYHSISIDEVILYTANGDEVKAALGDCGEFSNRGFYLIDGKHIVGNQDWAAYNLTDKVNNSQTISFDNYKAVKVFLNTSSAVHLHAGSIETEWKDVDWSNNQVELSKYESNTSINSTGVYTLNFKEEITQQESTSTGIRELQLKIEKNGGSVDLQKVILIKADDSEEIATLGGNTWDGACTVTDL